MIRQIIIFFLPFLIFTPSLLLYITFENSMSGKFLNIHFFNCQPRMGNFLFFWELSPMLWAGILLHLLFRPCSGQLFFCTCSFAHSLGNAHYFRTFSPKRWATFLFSLLFRPPSPYRPNNQKATITSTKSKK